MGSLTLEQFRAELIFDLRGRSDTSVPEGLSTTRQDMFLNAGYLHVSHPSVFRHREFMHAYTIPLASGTFSYAFTPNAGVVITGLRYVTHVAGATEDLITRRQKLTPKDEQWFQDRTHQSGSPRDYCVRGDNIILSPVPTANDVGTVISIGAWREPALLTAGQRTVLSTRWDEIVLLAARWRSELHLGYRDLAEATKMDFVGLINEYKDFEDLHHEDWDWMAEVKTDPYMETA